MAIFFPIFFGFMVGDVGFGIPFVILGFLGLKRCKSKEWRSIATMLFYGGICSIIFGLFLFGDMMGIPFWNMHPVTDPTLITWSNITGFQWPHLGIYDKIDDIQVLLYITIFIGFAHLIVGLLLGMYNVAIRHGIKRAILEKFSWVMILASGALLFSVMVGLLIENQPVGITDWRVIGFIVLFVPGFILALRGEGGKSILDLPETLSNVLSYTRLAAIGMSKAGMSLAFTYISVGLIANYGHASTLYLILALLVFIVGNLMIFILAIISAGLHSVRLQYVELFTKFYEGGGNDFTPLKIIRKHTKMEE